MLINLALRAFWVVQACSRKFRSTNWSAFPSMNRETLAGPNSIMVPHHVPWTINKIIESCIRIITCYSIVKKHFCEILCMAQFWNTVLINRCRKDLFQLVESIDCCLTVVGVTWSLCHCCLRIASYYRSSRDANSCSPDYISRLLSSIVRSSKQKHFKYKLN